MRYHFPGPAEEPILQLSLWFFLLAFIFLAAGIQWPIQHYDLIVDAGLLCAILGVVFAIPLVIYGDQPISDTAIMVLRQESDRFPLVRTAWNLACQGKHPSWKELGIIIHLVNKMIAQKN